MIGSVQVQPSGEQATEGKAPILGVHRTYLTDAGDKVPMPNAKMMLGRCKGGAVRFGPPAETVAVAEGIETALSITTACPGLVVWAALSTSGMKGLVLLATVATVILCPDDDPEGEAASCGASLGSALIRTGCDVQPREIPPSMILRRAGLAAV